MAERGTRRSTGFPPPSFGPGCSPHRSRSEHFSYCSKCSNGTHCIWNKFQTLSSDFPKLSTVCSPLSSRSQFSSPLWGSHIGPLLVLNHTKRTKPLHSLLPCRGSLHHHSLLISHVLGEKLSLQRGDYQTSSHQTAPIPQQPKSILCGTQLTSPCVHVSKIKAPQKQEPCLPSSLHHWLLNRAHYLVNYK